MVPTETRLLHPNSSRSVTVASSFVQTFFGFKRVLGGWNWEKSGKKGVRDCKWRFGVFIAAEGWWRGARPNAEVYTSLLLRCMPLWRGARRRGTRIGLLHSFFDCLLLWLCCICEIQWLKNIYEKFSFIQFQVENFVSSIKVNVWKSKQVKRK